MRKSYKPYKLFKPRSIHETNPEFFWFWRYIIVSHRLSNLDSGRTSKGHNISLAIPWSILSTKYHQPNPTESDFQLQIYFHLLLFAALNSLSEKFSLIYFSLIFAFWACWMTSDHFSNHRIAPNLIGRDGDTTEFNSHVEFFVFRFFFSVRFVYNKLNWIGNAEVCLWSLPVQIFYL